MAQESVSYVSSGRGNFPRAPQAIRARHG